MEVRLECTRQELPGLVAALKKVLDVQQAGPFQPNYREPGSRLGRCYVKVGGVLPGVVDSTQLAATAEPDAIGESASASPLRRRRRAAAQGRRPRPR